MKYIQGPRRAVAVALSLLLLLAPLMAYAEDDAAEYSAQAAAESQPEPEEPADTPDPTSEPAQLEDQTSPPADAVPDERPQASPQAPEPEQQYAIAWAEGAFGSQAVNYTDELVIGLGAGYQIDPEHDILVTRAGEPLDKRPKLDISYSSSNTKYLSVSASGRILGKKKGSAQVCVTVLLPDGSQKQLRKDVKVVDQPSISFAPDYAIIENGGTLDLGQYAKVPLLKASPNVDAGIRYSVAPRGKTTSSKVSLNKATGKLSVEYSAPGDRYVVTATTYAGQEARFTLYLGRRAERIEVTADAGAADESGRPAVKAGQSLGFKAAAYDADGAPAARQGVSWSLAGADGAASIDDQGVLRAAAGLEAEQVVIVTATAMDGSGTSGKLNAVIVP